MSDLDRVRCAFNHANLIPLALEIKRTVPKFCLAPECADQAGAFTADAPQGMGGPAGELPEIVGAQVG